MSSKVSSRVNKSRAAKTTIPHLIIEARAGTGKTTTLVEGLKVLKGIETRFVPSEQQRVIWESMSLSRDAKTICFVAFNKSIATELQARVPAGCDAMTMHSMGFRAVNQLGKFRVSEYRVQDLISKELGVDSRQLAKDNAALLATTKTLVSLCKVNLNNDPSGDDLDQLVSHYGIEINGEKSQAYSLVPKILARCKDPKADGCIDFDDMVWLPVVLDLPVTQYDVLLVDEAQDLNRAQQALARKAGRRLILCGDPKQAIYGFAGADSESMSRMFNELKASSSGCNVLPLTVTRRCGKAIVKEANKLVKDFFAFDSNPEGEVLEAKYPLQKVQGQKVEIPDAQTYLATIQPGDMAVCRVNAPLVNQCFRLIRRGVKATIQGRDVGKGLISLITKLKATNVEELVAKLSDWLHKEENKENAKRYPSETRIQGLHDRHDCILCFTEHAADIPAVIAKIEALFTDDKNAPGVRFSSIHKAKGLEAENVYYLRPSIASFPRTNPQPWEVEQESNLVYVAITRAIKKLVFVE